MSPHSGFMVWTAAQILAGVCCAAPEITLQPSSLSLTNGQVAVFTVGAPTAVSYQWLRNGAPLSNNDRVSGVSGPQLSISPVLAGDAGYYSVLVQDLSEGTTSTPAQLSMNVVPASFVVQAGGTAAAAGDSVSLTTNATGDGPIQHRWTRFGVPLLDDARINGATTATLQINPALGADAGLFWPTVTNLAGTYAGEPVRVVVNTPGTFGEATEFPQGVWSTSGTGWSAQDLYVHTGATALGSGLTNDGGQAHVETLVHGPGVLSFLWAVDSEAGFDHHICSVDGIEVGRISGQREGGYPQLWASMFVPIEWGTHVVRWTYSKDGSVARGTDAAYLDEVAFEPESLSSLEKSLPGLPFPIRTFGDALWFGQSAQSVDGFAARAGYIGHSQSSTLETVVCGPGELSFNWKASSENLDPLSFLVDGAVLDAIAGQTEWTSRTFRIPWGAHVLTWRYSKDHSVDTGSDTGWLDGVVYTQTPLRSLTEAAGQDLAWRASGSQPFFGQTGVALDAGGALQSGPIGHSAASSALASVTGPGSIRFRWKVSCENASDALRFRVNGSQLASLSGEQDWVEFAYALRPGPQSLDWSYTKDHSNAFGLDAGWVDLVAFTAAPSIGVALNAPYLSWTRSGDGVWFQDLVDTSDGVAAMRSGDIGDNQSTSLRTQVEGPGLLSFRWKVSAEGPDNLSVYIDGAEQGRIGGVQDWALIELPVSAGLHEVEWRYSKDNSAAYAADAAWVDTVTYLAAPSYATWSSARFSAEQMAQPTVSGPEANPSGDSIANLLKYAFNLDPRSAATLGGILQPGTGMAGMPHVGRSAGNALQVEYLRRKNASDLTYSVEFCTNLAGVTETWTPSTAAPSVSATDDPNWERVIVSDEPPPSALRRFSRVRVTMAP